MKTNTELLIPWKLLETKSKKDDCPMTKLAWYLQAVMEDDRKVDVTKIWVNDITYKKLENIVLDYFKKNSLSVKDARGKVGMYLLNVGPAQDFNNIYLLKDDYIYLTQESFID